MEYRVYIRQAKDERQPKAQTVFLRPDRAARAHWAPRATRAKGSDWASGAAGGDRAEWADRGDGA